jgi:hypothetical protein
VLAPLFSTAPAYSSSSFVSNPSSLAPVIILDKHDSDSEKQTFY